MIRKKEYKSCPPEQTIHKIKSIIKDKLQLDLIERTFIDSNTLFYSCRLIILFRSMKTRFVLLLNSALVSISVYL